MGLKVKVKVDVRKVESEEKVRKALSKLFPLMKFERKGDYLIGEGGRDDADFLREKVWQQKIIDTFRDELISRKFGKSTEVLLHKQAAYAGKLSLVEFESESPHGAIRVEFEFENEEEFERFLSWITPETKDGKIVWEKYKKF